MNHSRRSPAATAITAAKTQGHQIVTVEVTVRRGESPQAIDLLAKHCALSKQRIKDAMRKGAVWIQRRGRKPSRLRRVTTKLEPSDRLALYYDPTVLAVQPPQAKIIRDLKRYSIWYKPPGLLVEGSRFGDHATLSRQVEVRFEQKRPVLLVHRLDREASGVILVAHTPQAAARLSTLFRERNVEKEYSIEVRGDLRRRGAEGRIDQPLDGKPSVTDYQVIEYLPARDVTRVQILMQTGRYHQIRRHFADTGFPVMGDPKYGAHNGDPRGMQLVATALRFVCPWTGQAVNATVELPSGARLPALGQTDP
ncbi:MAG: RluA family pseudouridine synthase [Chromatiales bacterium]